MKPDCISDFYKARATDRLLGQNKNPVSKVTSSICVRQV